MLKISFSAISMLVRENGSNKERSFDKCEFFATKIQYSMDQVRVTRGSYGI